MTSLSRECEILAIDISSIAAALSIMKKEMLNAFLLLPKMQSASLSLEEIIRKSNFVEADVHHEAIALVESSNKFEVAICEIQERMTSLEDSLSRNAIIPDTLSTADDISVAFHIAVNGPVIDWPFAENVLERCLLLGAEELDANERCLSLGIEEFLHFSFGEEIWCCNYFENNITRLQRGGDCWRVRKSLELLLVMVEDQYKLSVSVETFNSLASILLQPLRSSLEDEEMVWAFIKRSR
jgi:hypothetical protein